jgi:hypothetical protein
MQSPSANFVINMPFANQLFKSFRACIENPRFIRFNLNTSYNGIRWFNAVFSMARTEQYPSQLLLCVRVDIDTRGVNMGI